jgi:hypothetical protein
METLDLALQVPLASLDELRTKINRTKSFKFAGFLQFLISSFFARRVLMIASHFREKKVQSFDQVKNYRL